MEPQKLILIFVILFFAYYKKRERDGNPIDFGGNSDSASSASGVGGASSLPSSIPTPDDDPTTSGR
tara:strand:+ start:193 stop:390 length:198 start_codon:yes stop_codon:yes gene_type:complete